MEYSSSKKVRLPGISFDFDNSDNSDESCCSSHNQQENNTTIEQENDNTNTVEQKRADIIEEMKSMGFQGASTILSSSTTLSNNALQQQQQQHSQPTEMETDINSQSTPSKRTLTNTPSSNFKQSRSTSKPRTKVSPTTSKLHTTANNLVSNTPNTTLDKVDNAVYSVIDSVNSVKKSIRRSLSPWKGRSDSDNNTKESGNEERGEQTMILDAAADYLYRMENQYNDLLSNPDNEDGIVQIAARNWEPVENVADNNDEELVNSSGGAGERINNEVEGIQRRSRRIQDKQIKNLDTLKVLKMRFHVKSE